MEQQSVRKTYKEKLRPTPTQERALRDVLWRAPIIVPGRARSQQIRYEEPYE